LAVVICYQFDWTWLRFISSEATLRFVSWFGYTGERLSSHLIAWNGERFEFGIACSFADVICGALPLLWIRNLGIVPNTALMVGAAAGLVAFNLLRQAAADMMFMTGLSWSVTDSIIGGLSYFAVWAFIVRWHERNSAITASTAATPSEVIP
jgi:hypothetical protein